MPRVFLSYARDDLHVATALCQRMEYTPATSVWFDRDSLYVGEDYRSIIAEEIEQADYCVALISAAYNIQRFQHFELEHAYKVHCERTNQNCGGAFLLPVYLSNANVAIPGFETIHHLDYRQDSPSAIRELINLLRYNFPSKSEAAARVLFQSHIAEFRGIPNDAYFLKIANVNQPPFKVTHMWVDVAEKEWHFEYADCRPMPSRIIKCGEEWETFIFRKRLPHLENQTYFEAFRIRLSNGQVYKSWKNDNVASYGKVAGGPLAPDEVPKVIKIRVFS